MFRFQGGVKAPDGIKGEHLWFVFRDGQLLVSENPVEAPLPVIRDISWFGFTEHSRHYLGVLDQRHCFAVSVGDEEPPSGFYFEDLRRFLGIADQETFLVAGRASQILEWDRNHRFCSRCGATTISHDEDRAKVCPACSYTQYPRINPCVIALITRGEEMLLARGVRFARPMYSTLAGFMEAGESAEEALHREVREEVGIEIANPRYLASQSWPFPHSLMLGFHADYAGGEIVLEEKEILDAGWFHPDALPEIPPKGTIARILIDAHIHKYRP